MDFDPTADTLHVTANNRQNLAINPNTGTVSAFGTPLSYVAGDVSQGRPPRVTGLAFTNSLPLALTTTLYGIDHARNRLVRFVGSPQSGQVATVGRLGLNVSELVGFDIQPVGNVGFATVTLPVSAASLLCQVNLQTGALAVVGRVGNSERISDIAVTRGGSFLIGPAFAPTNPPAVPTSPLPPTQPFLPFSPLPPTLTQPFAPGTVAPLPGTTFSGTTFTFGDPGATFTTGQSFFAF
jgi:hypothetical protein